jgi:hypothetical protein
MIVIIGIGLGVLWLMALLLAVGLCRGAASMPDRACHDEGRHHRPARRLRTFHS